MNGSLMTNTSPLEPILTLLSLLYIAHPLTGQREELPANFTETTDCPAAKLVLLMLTYAAPASPDCVLFGSPSY